MRGRPWETVVETDGASAVVYARRRAASEPTDKPPRRIESFGGCYDFIPFGPSSFVRVSRVNRLERLFGVTFKSKLTRALRRVGRWTEKRNEIEKDIGDVVEETRGQFPVR